MLCTAQSAVYSAQWAEYHMFWKKRIQRTGIVTKDKLKVKQEQERQLKKNQAGLKDESRKASKRSQGRMQWRI